MKGWPVYVVVAAVVVAVAAQIAVLNRRRPPSEAAELAELRGSVESLTGEVRELQAMLHVLRRMEAVSPVEPPMGEEPEARTESPLPPSNVEPVDIVLEVSEGGECILDGRRVDRETLTGELKKVLRANPAMRLVVKAHETVAPSELEAILGTAREAGIFRIALVKGPGEEASGGVE